MNVSFYERFRSVRVRQRLSLVFAVLFALVGILFLVGPDWTIAATNALSRIIGGRELQPVGYGFYQVLAVAYMTTVTMIAFFMYLHPQERIYPGLLVGAKGSSSILSLLMVVLHGPYLLYTLNFAVDGAIALLVYYLFRDILES